MWFCDLLNAVVASSYRHIAFSYLPGMDLPGKVRGDKKKCTAVMCCVPSGLWLPLSNQLTASPNWIKGFLLFICMQIPVLLITWTRKITIRSCNTWNAWTFPVVLATRHREENKRRCWKWFLLLRPKELKTITVGGRKWLRFSLIASEGK